jgi:nucleotide-binding universal stress UspA family protein
VYGPSVGLYARVPDATAPRDGGFGRLRDLGRDALVELVRRLCELMTQESGESMERSSAEKIVWPPVHLETILVPTDLRPDSKVALSFALALAQKFEANLVLLHVFAEPYSSDTEIGAGTVRLLDATREAAEREVARLEQQLRDQYSKWRSAFRIGSPFEQILREAADLKASLIVMASHSYGWFDRLVDGSDAERVLRQAPCPVLIARDS